MDGYLGVLLKPGYLGFLLKTEVLETDWDAVEWCDAESDGEWRMWDNVSTGLFPTLVCSDGSGSKYNPIRLPRNMHAVSSIDRIHPQNPISLRRQNQTPTTKTIGEKYIIHRYGWKTMSTFYVSWLINCYV